MHLFKWLRRVLGQSKAPVVEQTPHIPMWRIRRIGASEAYFIVESSTSNRARPRLLNAIDGRIFFSSQEEAQAVIDGGMWPLQVAGINTKLQWIFDPDKAMTSRDPYLRGLAFHLQTSAVGDRRYGNIYVQIVSDLHAKIAIVPGNYHDQDNEAWDNARIILIKDMYEEITSLWSELFAEGRMLEISARYIR